MARKRKSKSNKSKSNKSRSKKNRSLALRTAKLGFKGTVFLVKSSAKGIAWCTKKAYRAAKKQREIAKAKRAEKILRQAQPKITPAYNPFAVVESLNGNFESFEEKILQSKSTIGIILGARGTGKSAVGMRLLENVHANTGRQVYALGFSRKNLPPWINTVSSIEEIQNNSFVLIDEAGIEFSSRDSMTNVNKLLSSLLLISRHKDLSIAFISQSSANIEINILRQADYLLLKPSSLLQIDFERKKIKDIYAAVQDKFEKHKNRKGLLYVYSGNYRGFVENSLPSFWSTKVSKSYAGSDLK